MKTTFYTILMLSFSLVSMAQSAAGCRTYCQGIDPKTGATITICCEEPAAGRGGSYIPSKRPSINKEVEADNETRILEYLPSFEECIGLTELQILILMYGGNTTWSPLIF